MIGFFRALRRLFAILGYTMYHVYTAVIHEKVKGRDHERAMSQLKKWGIDIANVLGVKIDGDIPEIPEGVLLLPNHRSYIDIILVQALYPSSIVARRGIGKIPLLKSAVRVCDLILIDRKSPRSRLETFNNIGKKVMKGHSVIIFPEGTTTIGPEMKPLKVGAFKVAAQNNIPILPLALEYKHKDAAWIGDDTFFRHFFDFFRRKETPVKIKFGEIIRGDQVKEIQTEYKDWITTNCLEMRTEWDKSIMN